MTTSTEVLQKVSSIWYPVQFSSNPEVHALLDSRSEVNAMTPTYAAKLGLITQKTDIDTEKIDGLALKIYGMVIASFLVQDRLEMVWFFEKTFLLANTNIQVVLKMAFLIFLDTNIWFAEKELTWRSYMTVKALPTTRRVKLINKKEFAAAAIDKDSETFVVHVASIIETMSIYLARKAQIAALQADTAPTKVSAEYSDYIDVFSTDLAIDLFENTGMNEYAIKLTDEKQLPFKPIYALNSIKLETLKAYMKTHLKTGFV